MVEGRQTCGIGGREGALDLRGREVGWFQSVFKLKNLGLLL